MAGKTENCTNTALPELINGKFPALPDELAAKIDAIEQCVRAGKRLAHWLSVLVARARDDYADPGAWLDDMTARFGWQRAHIHHMRAVGDLFWSQRHSECYTVTLLECDIQKLLSISRLPADKVGPFLEAGDPSTQTRDQVRARVTKWLGEDAPAKTPTPKQLAAAAVMHQPTFIDELFNAQCTEDDERRWRIQIGLRAQEASATEKLAAALRAMNAIDELAPRLDLAGGHHLVLAAALREEADKLEKLKR